MSDDWYAEWVKLHCTATAADAATVRALLSDVVRKVLLDSGKTTPEELGEVTARLVANHDTPKFANEHADRVGLELVRLREDRRQATIGPPVASPGDFPPDCPACGGSGYATIPVRACVMGGRIVLHPVLKRVVTGAVLCDRPGCAAGQHACEMEAARDVTPRKNVTPAPRRPRLSRCEAEVGGRDLPELLREVEREEARRARATTTHAPGNFPNLRAILGARESR